MVGEGRDINAERRSEEANEQEEAQGVLDYEARKDMLQRNFNGLEDMDDEFLKVINEIYEDEKTKYLTEGEENEISRCGQSPETEP